MKVFTGIEQTRTNTPNCPDCGSHMISRLNKKSNRRFWGCSKFPECKGTRDTDGRSKAEREQEKADLMSDDYE